MYKTSGAKSSRAATSAPSNARRYNDDSTGDKFDSSEKFEDKY